MPPGIAAKRRAFGRSLDRLTLADAHLSHLGDRDLAILDLDPLRDAKPRPVPFPALEPGMPCSLLEEVDEGAVEAFEGLLEGLAIDLVQPGRLGLLLQGGQLSRQLRQADRFAVLGVVVLPPPQSPVPDEPAGTRHATQEHGMGLGGLHEEAIDLVLGSHRSIPRCLLGNVAFDRLGRYVACRAAKEGTGPERWHPEQHRELLPEQSSALAF